MGFFSLKQNITLRYDRSSFIIFQFPLWDFSRWNKEDLKEILHTIHLSFNSLYGIFLVETDMDFLLFSAFQPDLFSSQEVSSIISFLQRYL